MRIWYSQVVDIQEDGILRFDSNSCIPIKIKKEANNVSLLLKFNKILIILPRLLIFHPDRNTL